MTRFPDWLPKTRQVSPKPHTHTQPSAGDSGSDSLLTSTPRASAAGNSPEPRRFPREQGKGVRSEDPLEVFVPEAADAQPIPKEGAWPTQRRVANP